MPRGSVPTRCVQCGHPLVANHITPTPAGMRKHSGRGLCSACHKADMRGVERQPENAAPTGFHDQPWADQALCNQTDPEAFFPEKGGSTREAKQVCNGNPEKGIAPCPVRSECLDWALATEQRFGIWGGHSERERRKLKKQVPEQLAATGTDGPTATADTTETTDEQPAPRSYGLAYIGGAHAHRPIPLATDVGVRPAHQPKAPRPTGLDWAKHTAPEPEKPTTVQPVPEVLRCRWCRQPAGDLVDDVCDDCRDTAERQFHAPDHTALGRELADLERTDPKVAAAAASYDDMVDRITRPEDHIKLPTEGKQGQPTTGSSAPGATSTSSTTGRAPVAGSSATTGGTAEKKNPGAGQETRPAPAPGLDVVNYCARLLRDTATSTDPLVQMLRGSALTVLAALDHAHHPETPAATPTPKVAAGPNFEVFPRTEVRREARRAAARQPRPRRSSSTFRLAEAQRLYLEEQKTCAEIATTLGSTVATVRKQLKAAGTPMRDDRARGSGGWNKKTADDDNPDLVDAARRHYIDEQLTLERTAAAVGLSPKGLIGLMNRHGIERRPPANTAGQAPRWQKLDDQAVATICDRYKAGDSTVMLAEAYRVSTPTITNALRRSGVQLRTPAEARRLALTRKENQ